MPPPNNHGNSNPSSDSNSTSSGPRAVFHELEASVIPQLQEMQTAHENLFDPMYKVVYVLLTEISRLKHRVNQMEKKNEQLESQLRHVISKSKEFKESLPSESVVKHSFSAAASSRMSRRD